MVARASVMFALGSALAALPALVAAQERGAPSSPSDITEIEVLGQRELARQVFKQNLEQLTAPLSVTDTIPRFYQPLCVEVAGIAPDQARAVSERIVRTSREAGLPPPQEGCRTNALVIVVDDPERMYDTLVSTRLDLVGILPFRDVHARRLRDDVKGGKPVVWWNVLGAANSQGSSFNDLGLAVAPDIAASRTTAALYQPKVLSVVMYDAGRLGGATLDQIADHAALHILGTPRRQIAFDAVDVPSILSLFADEPGTAPAALTDFDRAYLKGLYNLGPGAYQSRVPRSVVAAYAAQCEAQGSDCRIRLRN